MSSLAFKAIVLVVYGPMYLAGLIGNALVVILVIADRRIHTIPNMFITQLAVGDFMILFFCLPFTVVSFYLFEEWVFGEAFCKANKFFQTTGCYISIFTLMAMSFERYFVLIHPMKARAIWTKRKACYIMVCVLLIASLAALPLPITTTLTYIPVATPSGGNDTSLHTVAICIQSPGKFSMIYNSCRVILFYLLPVVVISVLYGQIIYHIWATNRGKQCLHDNAKVKKERQSVIRMLLTMILVFILSWLPVHIMLALEISPSTAHLLASEEGSWAMFFAALFLYSNCITNPIIYSFMSDRFRQGFRQILCGCKCTASDDEKYRIFGTSSQSGGSDTKVSTVTIAKG